MRRVSKLKYASFTLTLRQPYAAEIAALSWRVALGESGSPELLGSPRTSPELSRTSPASFFLSHFPGSSLTVELNSNPELSLGNLTPSPDSQKLSLILAPSPIGTAYDWTKKSLDGTR